MRRITTGVLTFVAATGLAASLTAPAAGQPRAADPVGSDAELAAPSDALANPLADKQNSLRREAITQVVNGEATPEVINGTEVVRLGETATADTGASARGRRPAQRDQYVPLSLERTDQVFVILVEFGDERHPDYPDVDTDPATVGPATWDGPLHNEIPEPGPDDNSTQWRPDFDRSYFEQLYFGTGRGVESLKTYYEKQSSGRYTVDGTVTDWVKVQYNQARYGRSNGFPCDDIVCDNTWNLVADGVNQWVANQQAAGLSDAEIAAMVAEFDVLDRYDYDGDGDFNEPDGYIDRFQIIHAGGDQADGDPIYGEDAIWSHRWYAFLDQIGSTGPDFNQLGGTQIGETGIWVGDYTIQPENGGLSVVAHEYGHDLGLPDHYDTAASGDNPVSWWTLMAQSRVSAKGDQGIGTRAADLSAWDKLQLGWLDYEVVLAGQNRKLELGPHEYNSAKAQAAVVVLPKKEVTTELATPPEGEKSWWSGTGDGYTATMAREVTLPAGSAELTFQAAYNIEDCGSTPCDYAYVEVDDGSGWTAIPGSIANAAEGNGIDGLTDGFVPATFDLSAYADSTIGLRVRYSTDGAAQGNGGPTSPGIFIDTISVTAGGQEIFADGAETPPNGWELDGFASVGASVTNEFDHYYLASNRQYVSYDRYLKTGPYNFGFPSRPDFAEHFPYQDGLLVSYWDTSYTDNNTSQHPGSGEILPIDSHPRVIYNLDGDPWRGRIQTYDAPFGLEKADSFTLHHPVSGQASYIRGQAGNPVFDDSKVDRYFDPALPRVGVKVAGVGVKIKVLQQSGTSITIRIS